MKRWMWLLALLTVGCEIEEIGLGNGTIHVKNEDSAPQNLLVTDNTSCVVGLHSTVQPEAIRMFNINEEGAFICVGEDPPAFPVQDGKSYMIQDNKLVETSLK